MPRPTAQGREMGQPAGKLGEGDKCCDGGALGVAQMRGTYLVREWLREGMA